MRRSSIIRLVVAQIALSCVPFVVLAATAFDQAMQEYKAHGYDKAAADLSVLVQQQPRNASAHYMLGCCLTRLDQIDSAEAQFKSALECDKTGQVRPLAVHALNRLVAIPRTTPEPMPGEIVANSVAAINDHAYAGLPYERQMRMKWIEDQERTALTEDMKRYGDNGRPNWDPKPKKQAMQTHKDYWEKEKERVADIDSERNIQLHESARGLADQLQITSGNARLVPGLTNLYVRTYSCEGSPASAKSHYDKGTKLPEQLSADQEQLILQPVNNKLVSHVVPAPQAAGQDKLNLYNKKDNSQRELDVFGRITHK